MGWLAEYRTLNPDEKRVALAAAAMLAVARAGLSLLPLPTLRDRMGRWAPVKEAWLRRVSADRVGRLVAAVGRRLPVPTTCLSEAVVCEALLSRAGRRAALRIGVTRDQGGGLASHAWVECGRTVVIGDRHDLGRYARLRH